jgi:hypothetical protein
MRVATLANLQEEKTVIPFTASTSTTSGDADQLDRAGQTILQLLNKAAGAAEENSKKAIDMAERLPISRIGGDWVSIRLVINLTVSLRVRMNGAWRKRVGLQTRIVWLHFTT